MTLKTLQLALYKNCDPDQPVTFTGSDRDVVLSKLRAWMTANNGEDDKPCQIDGLTLVVNDVEPYEICLTWTEYYKNWEIDWGGGHMASSPKWNQARNAFTDACSYEIWPEDRDDRDDND